MRLIVLNQKNLRLAYTGQPGYRYWNKMATYHELQKGLQRSAEEFSFLLNNVRVPLN